MGERRILGRGTTMTAEEATEEGYLAMDVLEVLKARCVNLEPFALADCYFERELFWEISGTLDSCGECGAEVEGEWSYCPYCGEGVKISERYKSRAEAAKSKYADLGIKDMVSFWVRVKPAAPADLVLQGGAV